MGDNAELSSETAVGEVDKQASQAGIIEEEKRVMERKTKANRYGGTEL